MTDHLRSSLLCGLLTLTVTMFAGQSVAATRYVDDSATAGANDGTSWANAYTNLQTALTAAVAVDQIWVAEGTYTPTYGTDRAITFPMKADVALYGSFVGNETSLSQRQPTNHSSVLSGDLGVIGDRGDNSYRIISAPAASGARLDGFTITLADNHVNGNRGGGMDIAAASPMTIENCLFSENYASEGGALQVASVTTVRNCIFLNNSSDSRGGAVQCYTSSHVFENCVFVGNFCDNGRGGAMSLYHQPATLQNCSFFGNTAVQGSVYVSNGGTLNANDCIFWDSGAHGGGIWVKSNSSNPGAGGYASGATVTFSDVNGGFNPPELGNGSDNIDVDPLYVNTGSGDLHLQALSPCIDAGTPAGAPADDADGGSRPIGDGFDMGAYEFGSTVTVAPPTGLAFFIHSAIGSNTIPVQWHFEGIAPGTAIVNNGLGDYGFEGFAYPDTNVSPNYAAISVAETPLPAPPNGYPLPSESHANVMQVYTAIGNNSGVSANFATNQTAGNTYVYVDFMMQAIRLNADPLTPQGAQAGGYFNSNGLLVVCNSLYTNAFSAQLNRAGHNGVAWTELSHAPVDSNAWVRLTITMDYLGAGPSFSPQEHYYSVALNGQVLTSDKAYRSSMLDQGDGDFPIPAGPDQTNMWFLCADSGFGNGALEPENQPNNAFFSALAFDGAGRVDEVVISVSPSETTTSTTSTSTTSTTSTTETTTTSSTTTATPPDTTPPGPVTNLQGVDVTPNIDLTWNNPADGDFAGVLVLRRLGAPPTGGPVNGTTYVEGEDIGDGTVMYAEAGNSGTPGDPSGWQDQDPAFPPAGVFYYAVFAYDANVNYAPGPVTSVGVNVGADSDGDGMLNGDEYVAGTDALDADSLLAVVEATAVGTTVTSVETDAFTQVVYTQEILFVNGLLVGWPSVTNRLYSLYSGTNMEEVFSLLVPDLPATPPLNVYTSDTTGASVQFYRVVVTEGEP